jgi:transcriptional regulator with XRE-family HTH domain
MMGSTLIAILERCGVRQSEIAKELGVSRATVSRWARRDRQMSRAQRDRLFEWAHRIQLDAMVSAEAHDAATPSRSLLDPAGQTAARLKFDLERLWHDYQWEIAPTAFHAAALAILQRWGAYSQNFTPESFDPKLEEIDRLWEDSRRLRGWIATWRRLHQPAAEGETTHGV